MNENFKTELTAFAKDLRKICKTHTCANCPLGDKHGVCICRMTSDSYNPNKTLAAVEAYRKSRKPCAEVIDRALDIYTIEVEIVRDKDDITEPAEVRAERARAELDTHYQKVYYKRNKTYAVRVLSVKRFVLESHREEDEDED